MRASVWSSRFTRPPISDMCLLTWPIERSRSSSVAWIPVGIPRREGILQVLEHSEDVHISLKNPGSGQPNRNRLSCADLDLVLTVIALVEAFIRERGGIALES